jgi:hypothetical protein
MHISYLQLADQNYPWQDRHVLLFGTFLAHSMRLVPASLCGASKSMAGTVLLSPVTGC